MTGSPIDGIPWWGKALYFIVLAPVAVYDKAAQVVEKIKSKRRKK